MAGALESGFGGWSLAFFCWEYRRFGGGVYFFFGKKNSLRSDTFFLAEKIHPTPKSARSGVRKDCYLSYGGFGLIDRDFQANVVSVQQHRIGFNRHVLIFQALTGNEAEVLFI